MADTEDLKSSGSQGPCGFESRPRHLELTTTAVGPCLLCCPQNAFDHVCGLTFGCADHTSSTFVCRVRILHCCRDGLVTHHGLDCVQWGTVISSPGPDGVANRGSSDSQSQPVYSFSAMPNIVDCPRNHLNECKITIILQSVCRGGYREPRRGRSRS